MIAVSAVVLQVLSCLGLGAAALRIAGVLGQLAPSERLAWSFALGLGCLGWLVFFAGILGAFQAPALVAILAASALGIFILRLPGWPAAAAPGPLGLAVFGVLGVSAAMDLLEALAPAADADTMAYHYDLPRRFLEAGRIIFVPRAFDGAAPLLVQMTHVPVLALGGGRAANLWTMASGFAAAFLLYAVSRRYLSPLWSAVLALIFLTSPAVVYGAGTGQVEVRLALFAVVAAFAAGEALARGASGFAVVAGLAAGFYMGGKFFGLLFAAAVGLVLLWGRGWLARGAVFAAAALAAGSQWYLWNWLHTGDPLFPVLYGILPYGDAALWDAAHHRLSRELDMGGDRVVPTDLFWFLAYPFAATLWSPDGFESLRTGLGPYLLLLAPLALGGSWLLRRELRKGPLAASCLIVVLFYAIWFFSGTAQRVRHLLPVYPLALLLASVAAARLCERIDLKRPLIAAVVLTVLIQIGGQGLFTVKFARYVFGLEDREAFLEANVSRYAAAKWVNANLEPGAVVMSQFRDLNYLIKPTVFFAHPTNQSLVDVLPGADDPQRFLRQVRERGITHAIGERGAGADEARAGYQGLLNATQRHGCFKELVAIPARARVSRTLPALGETESVLAILSRTDDTCPW
ncbi:MAG: hypothetical protein ACT4P2_07760 [Pseudomonadota bacterium]